jgi:hypothetical protein
VLIAANLFILLIPGEARRASVKVLRNNCNGLTVQVVKCKVSD